MELLRKQKTGDVLHYAIAYLLLAVTFVVAWGAMNQLRLSMFLVTEAITQDARWLRLVNMVTWIVFVTAVAVYTMAVEHFYRSAVTEARVRSARMHPGIPEPQSRFFRFLRRYDLDLLGATFLRFFTGTVVALGLFFGLERLLTVLLPG